MPNGVELATAYIQLLPSLRGVQRDIARQMGPIGQRTGQQFGQDFNNSAQDQINSDGGPTGDQEDKAPGLGAKFGSLFGAAAAAGITLAIGASIKSAIDQEVDSDRTAAALGASPREAARLGSLAGKIYGDNFGDSFGDVTAALDAVRSSFRDLGTGKELRTVTEQALNFADIFQIDLPRAVSVSQTIVKAGLAKDATEALDLLTASAQRVPAALRENILDAADEYGQFFETIGFGGEETFTALVDNAKLGEFGIDKAGDAIKEFTILSTDLSTNSVAAYKTLGLSAKESANDILAGGDRAKNATQNIVDGLLSIKNPAKQANTAISLFGTPLEDLGVKNIPTFLKSLQNGRKGLGNFAGAIDRAGVTANDNASRNIEAFKRQVTQTFVDLIGKKVLPFVKEFAAELSARLGPVVDKAREGLAKAAPILSRVGQFLQKNREYVKAFAIGLAVVAGAIGAVTLATTLFSLALAATGIPLIIVGLAALVAGIIIAYKRSEDFREVVASLGEKVRTFADFLKGTVLPAVTTLARQVGGSLKPIFDQLAATFVSRVLPALIVVFAKIRQALPALLQIAAFVIRVIGVLIRLGAAILGKVLPPLIRFYGFMFSKIIPVVASVASGAVRLIGKLASVGSATINLVANFKRFATGVGEAVDRIVRKVTDGIGGIPGKIIGYVKDMTTAGKEFIGGLFQGMKDAARGVGGLIGDIAGAVGDAIKGAINNLIQKLNDGIPNKIALPGAPDIDIKDNPIPYLARGTRNFGGGLAVVGERGPELVTLPRGSRVDTAAATRRIVGSPAPLAAASAGGGAVRGSLVITNWRDGTGYFEEVADDRIGIAQDMTDGRVRATWSR